MTALLGDRRLSERHYGDRNFPVAANVVIWENGLVVVDGATGLAKSGSTAVAADKCVGAARIRADNRGGAASAISVEAKCDTVRNYWNSGGADAIAMVNIGADCFIVDDQTVALTNGGGTRCRAGKVWNVTEAGVWVRFDT